MSRRPLLGALALLLVAAGLTAALAPQDKPKASGTPQEAGTADEMPAWMNPGAEHKVFDGRVGKWTGIVKFWPMGPDGPAMESPCTSEYKLIFGSRYLKCETTGDMGGSKFEGLGLTGFDVIKKQYFNTWIDTMGTGIIVSDGTYDAGSKTFTYMGESPDMTGKYTPTKLVEREVGKDSFVMEMHATDAGSGKMAKVMEITYTRAK